MKRVWVPLLVGLLAAGVLGIGGGGAVAVEPRVTTRSVMIPAAAFVPANDDSDYYNLGIDLHVHGEGLFYAPLSFPVPVVSIQKITIYAYDNNPAANVCITLYRSRPTAPGLDQAGEVCTGDSTAAPQVRSITAISPRQVNTALQGVYLEADFSGSEVFISGVKITYTYDTP